MRGTQTISASGHLVIGGVDTVELAREYGTPLYVYDTALIKERINQYKEAFAAYNGMDWQVAYASKAFSTIAILQLVNEFGLSLDVVSGGELYTALKAGFPAGRIHFHGNNKSDDELILALDANIGNVIVDNFYELERLEDLCAAKGREMEILLRVTPGVEAHTHEFIMTGHDDTKFGFNLDNGMADQAVQLALKAPHLILKGIHCHIGSQIFETEGFVRAIRVIFSYAEKWKRSFDFSMQVLNVGGGFGIRYTEEDHPLPVKNYIDSIVAVVTEECKARALSVPAVWIEPGRSIVGESGTTLYTVGALKDIPGIRKYVSVDGGMADNIRPALYQAHYEALCASRANEPADQSVAIAGKCCENGDVLIKKANLPESCRAGDILAVLCTGAYGYSMASHYNRLPNPAVVFVENGESQLVVRRESYDDLIRMDQPLKMFSSHE
ncbi:diaminopimelate decarboxylase [Sporolactobacillus shoreae]|uniref:Diaminopimelate decarboxylase n=1 Tax=Sporolactobacillus shoreae TaxID=1465501 RepID=A0A4Z0GQ23_9BACL|nr:diaminopimelate decarboxylase [Sporolactobacillus shoreae]TGA98161.1 diaminopimelate decarboxylase [Sporolactobacillus shoreae]